MTEPHHPDASSSARRRSPSDDEVSLWEVLAVLVRRRWTIVSTALVVGVLAGAIAHLLPLKFTTSTAFRPQGAEANNSQIMALASQFGVSVPGGSGDEASPDFYAELLRSREILTRIAGDEYEVAGMGSVLLKDLLEIEEPTEEIRDQETLVWLLDEAISVTTGAATGTVTLSVTSEWPDLSVAIAERLLDEVSRFNMETRQSQAASERAFIQGRVDDAEADLEAAEDSMRVFLEQNRRWEDSPLLTFRHGALQREVSQRSAVLTTLMQSFVQAEIAEVRDTPVITVLQPPFVPAENDPRRRVLSTLLGVILGGLLGVVLAFIIEAFRRPGDGDPAREDFDESWDGFVRSIPIVGRR